jgi:hypothetical protein
MSTSTAGAPPGPDPSARRPLGQVVASIVEGMKTLARQRVELARMEATEAAAVRAKGAGMFGAAGVVVVYGVGFVAAAGAAALAIVLPVWAAILIVGVVLFLIAGILVVVGRRTIQNAPAPGRRTRETLKEDARWAKQRIGS